jgi:hypothetical protein
MSFVERRRFLWILFFAGIALAAAVANATTLAPLTFETLARQSSAVARLRCVSSASSWDGGEIWTETRFEVLELHKGALGHAITVRMLGGRAGSLYSRVDGVPAFRTGEEVYLFLWGHPGEPYRVLGWSQGTFRISHDPRSEVEKVTQESATGNFDAHTHEFKGDGIRGMALLAFKQKLRMALEQRAADERLRQ